MDSFFDRSAILSSTRSRNCHAIDSVAMRPHAPVMLKRCYVCGSPDTVRAHLSPRALAHDLRAGDIRLLSGQIGKEGIQYLQSGRWSDKILCDEHEKALGDADDHGIRLIRSVKERRTADFTIANPKPFLLQKFALSIIWRKDVEDQAQGSKSQLGPYERPIRQLIFHEGAMVTPIALIQSNLTADGKYIEIAMEPTRARLRGANAWKFGFGGIEVIVQLDSRPWPADWEPVNASRNAKPLVLVSSPIELSKAKAFHPLIRQMKGLSAY